MRALCIVLATFLLAACGNDFEDFYHPAANAPSHVEDDSDRSTPMLVQGSDDPNEDFDNMLRRGFVVVGYSHFTSGHDEDQDDLLDQARSVHANTVVYYTANAGTVSGTIPISTPTTQTSNTEITGSAYGADGTTMVNGNVATTTYGTTTTYIPYTIQRHEHLAVYWAKGKTPILGLIVRDMDDQEKEDYGTNKGAVTTIVVDDSPAYNADIVPNDVIKRIGTDEITTAASVYAANKKYAGQQVTISYLRKGKPGKVKLTMNADQYLETPAPAAAAAAAAAGTGNTAGVPAAPAKHAGNISYATVIVNDTGDESKNLAIANRSCANLNKVAQKDEVRDNGTIAYLCVDP